jgi:hypothetical protein
MQNTHLASQLIRLALVLSLWLTPLAWGQNVTASRLNPMHPLVKGLQGWWLVQPRLFGGGTLWNIFPKYPLALTNMGTGSGWSPTSRAGWGGEMRLDGTDDHLTAGILSPFDCVDTTCTIQVRFRSTNNTGTANIVGKRDPCCGLAGGWVVRITPTAVLVRISDVGNGSTFQRVSTFAGANSGAWVTVLAVLTTDTVTIANNAITLYINGVADAGTPTSGTNPYSPCINCNFIVGAGETGNAPILGALDDVRWWDRGLTATEALQAYRSQPPLFAGMVTPQALAVSLPAAAPVKHRVRIE